MPADYGSNSMPQHNLLQHIFYNDTIIGIKPRLPCGPGFARALRVGQPDHQRTLVAARFVSGHGSVMKRHDFTNKTVLITGAASGIGLACAKLFNSRNARLILSDINGDAEMELKKLFGGRAEFLQQDVSDESSWESLTYNIAKRGESIDALVNSAGTSGLPDHTYDPITGVSLENWRHIFKVNVEGTMLGCKHILPIMQKQRRGAIVNIASRSGVNATPWIVSYGASKGTILQLTKSIAIASAEQGEIRCNVIAPGQVDTPMYRQLVVRLAEKFGFSVSDMQKRMLERVPLKRFAQAEEVAEAIAFLASDASAFITGQCLTIDGGMSINN